MGLPEPVKVSSILAKKGWSEVPTTTNGGFEVIGRVDIPRIRGVTERLSRVLVMWYVYSYVNEL
jgi:hypothetical protein